MSLSRPAMSAIRFGYGIRPGEPVPDGPEALLAQIEAGLAESPRFPAEGIDGRWRTIADFYLRISELPAGKTERRAAVRPLRKAVFHANGRDQHARVAQAVFSPHGFYERLAAFWTDHFAVSARKQRPMYLYTSLFEAEVVRRRLAGPFASLLRDATTHPAMLIYLDNAQSVGADSPAARRLARRTRRELGLNENYARELLELHTLGVDGGYSQADVTEVARILTGWSLELRGGRLEYRFKPGAHDRGAKRVLGEAYPAGHDEDEVVELGPELLLGSGPHVPVAPADGEAELDQQPLERGVLVEAVAQPAARHHAVHRSVDRVRAAEVDRQVVVGDAGDVRAVDLAEADYRLPAKK